MKKIFLGLFMLALVLTAVPRTNGDEVTVDFLYNNLSGGSWIDADDYGYGWQPDVAVNSSDWRPYADGYWAYTDYGWTWISYEDFGWATYHYGRWAKLADYGWVWFPGSDLEWGPAWVSWRTGGDQIGWAPLPPRGPGVVYDGRPIGGQVDIDFDIGPAYYNFVDVRYIGEPVLRSHLYAPSYNVTYVNQTVNVTNISVKNKFVYNYGPDIEVLSRHSSRPIQRLKIERDASVDVSAAVRTGGLTKVQGDRLVLSGPQRFEKSNKQGATPKIKNKIARNQLKLERGWGVAGDEKAQMELKQRIRIQDPRKVAPPTAGIQTGAAGAMGASGTIGATGAMGAAGATPMGTPVPATAPGMAASPITSATLAPNPSSFEKGKGRGKRGQAEESKAQPPAGAMGDSASPAASAAPMDQMERGRGKNKGRRGQEPGMSAPPSGAMSPAMEATPAGIERGKGKGKRNQDLQGAPSPSTGETPPSGNSEKMRGMNREQGASAMPGAGEGQVQGQGKHKGRRLDQPPGGPGEQTGAPAMGGQESQGMPSGGGKQKGRAQTIDPAEPTTGGASGTGEPGQGKHKGRGPAMEPSQPATGAAPTGDEQRGGGKQGKRKGAQETPTPIPQ